MANMTYCAGFKIMLRQLVVSPSAVMSGKLPDRIRKFANALSIVTARPLGLGGSPEPAKPTA